MLGPQLEQQCTLKNKGISMLGLSDAVQHPFQSVLDRKTLGIELRTLGPEHPATLGSMVGLATALTHLGQYAEAERLSARRWALIAESSVQNIQIQP